jgi:hypothetical protein
MRSSYAPQAKGTSDAPLAPVPSEILDQFVRQGPISHGKLEAAVRRFTKAITERALGGELTHHLGYPPGGAKPEDTTNHRNGAGSKTVLTDDGPLSIDVPRDREGTFELRPIPNMSAGSPLRRQDARAVPPCDERPRDSGIPGGDARRGYLACSDQHGDPP